MTCLYADVAVVGGGLAGSLAAIHLARHGIDTLIFEKELAAHHKVCGEFISGEGLPYLREIDIDLRRLGAVEMNTFHVHGPRHSLEARLPFPALGLSRKRLDEELLSRAAAEGAKVLRGVQVKGKSSADPGGEKHENEDETIVLETSAGRVHARRLVIATGKHEFKAVQVRKGKDSGLVGFKQHVRLKRSIALQARTSCELFVFKNGYGGISPVEDGLFNFCFLIERTALREIGAGWKTLVSHIAQNHSVAAQYLDGAEPLLPQFATVARIPYGFVREEIAEPGVYCVGDQIAVIPSLTGDGISIALATGKAAAHAILTPSSHGQLRPALSSRVYEAEVTRHLRRQVNAGYYLHRLFKSPSFVDVVAWTASLFPPFASFMFHQTRCRIGAPWPRSLECPSVPSDIKRKESR